MAGWLAGPESPNVDGLLWFVHEVLPIVRARVPWVRVRVSGPAPPKVALDAGGRGIFFEGQVSNMAEFYGRTRACIVPLRYGAGVKIKTVEALQYGVPTVATNVGAEGIDLRGTEALLVADDAQGLRRGARFPADRSRGLGPADGPRSRSSTRCVDPRGPGSPGALSWRKSWATEWPPTRDLNKGQAYEEAPGSETAEHRP